MNPFLGMLSTVGDLVVRWRGAAGSSQGAAAPGGSQRVAGELRPGDPDYDAKLAELFGQFTDTTIRTLLGPPYPMAVRRVAFEVLQRRRDAGKRRR